MKTQLTEIAAIIKDLAPVDVLRYFTSQYPGLVTFSTSFGWEDQVVTDLIFKNDVPIEVFTLETGRLFPETYYVWNRTLEIYQKPIHAYFPQTASVQAMVNAKGPSSFYESVENRKECCHIRKIEPLKRALQGKKIWVTGIRAEQSVNRHDMTNLEWDEQNQLLKYHPLFDWSLEQVKVYIKENNVVYNTLHDKGFPSIGCAPCTRAVAPGEDFRAGRWWWEDQSKKECGLHATQ
ncbi:phosphoadenylyl-sulfate reductase [Pedobacter sp.]|uniref:phosphoadenylyl-sulfate reductase n=1 Tax=Pedobacter sp. TaxID=1411316 RepID=UPI003D7FBCD8